MKKSKIARRKIMRAIAGPLISYTKNKKLSKIAKHFEHYLEPVIVSSEDLKNEVFRMRHSVYCEELGLFPETESGLEIDGFDEFSTFCLIKHKQSGVYAGCVRVVTPMKTNEELPLQYNCRESYKDHEMNPDLLDQSEICEFSRLAVKAEFRRRKSDKIEGAATGGINEATYSEDELRCFPFISLGLYLTGIVLGIELGKKHGFVMMEPRLAKSLRKIGIKFVQLGEPVDYHGLRAPYYCNEDILLKSLAPPIRDLMEIIRLRVQEQIADHPALA